MPPCSSASTAPRKSSLTTWECWTNHFGPTIFTGTCRICGNLMVIWYNKGHLWCHAALRFSHVKFLSPCRGQLSIFPNPASMVRLDTPWTHHLLGVQWQPKDVYLCNLRFSSGVFGPAFGVQFLHQTPGNLKHFNWLYFFVQQLNCHKKKIHFTSKGTFLRETGKTWGVWGVTQ